MKPNPAFKYLLLIMCALQVCFALAQNGFAYKAALDSVPQSGFYTIPLTPAIVAKCMPALQDIRIKDNNNADVPYLIRHTAAALNTSEIVEFPLIKTGNAKNTIIKNTLPGGISQLQLFIKNTDAYRTITLSGGDDTSHWFAIKENIILSNSAPQTNNEVFQQTLSFPYSNYRYFQISILGKDVLPVNVVKAGIYRYSSTNGRYNLIPAPLIKNEKPRNNKSYFLIQFDDYYLIDKMQVFLSGTKFFNRSFKLYNSPADEDAAASGYLSSKNMVNEIEVHVKTNKLSLVINDEDNAPLKVDSFVAFQLPVSLTAYLEAGKNYNLLFADSAGTAPSYDLHYFTDSINSGTQILQAGNIEKITLKASLIKEDNTLLRKWILWSAIILVLAFLLFFSYKIIKDISNKPNNNASV